MIQIPYSDVMWIIGTDDTIREIQVSSGKTISMWPLPYAKAYRLIEADPDGVWLGAYTNAKSVTLTRLKKKSGDIQSQTLTFAEPLWDFAFAADQDHAIALELLKSGQLRLKTTAITK